MAQRNRHRSGNVMQKVGMIYRYSYEEQWQPKDFPVIFKMYQLNFDGNEDFVYKKYWNMYSEAVKNSVSMGNKIPLIRV